MIFGYSLSTIYMTILTSNLLLILIALFFRSNKVMINLGYRLLAVFVCITFFRFLLPFEFSFTKNIFLPPALSLVIVFFRHPFFFIGSFGVSLWTLLEIVWLVGCIIYFVRYIREVRMIKRYILLLGKQPSAAEKYMSILDEICKTRGKKNTFRILELDDLDSPKICGIRRPYILLPTNLSFSDEDMYYVLTHEASHHFHHDLFLKGIVRILSIVYWWNPACHYLYKKTNLLLEMRIDDNVAKDQKAASKYLGCLLLLAESMHQRNHKYDALGLSFSQASKSDLTKRFSMLIHRGDSRNLILNIAIFSTILLLYVLSYFFILEASYSPPDVAETIYITKDSSYFIDNGDGSYDLYYGEIFFETVSDLRYFADDVPIYTREEMQQFNFD